MKKALFLTLIVVGSLLAKTPSCDSAELKGAVEGINQSSPAQVDSDTILVGAQCADGELIYKFKLTEASSINSFGELQLNIARNVMANVLKESYCDKNNDVSSLREFTNAVVWSYDYADGKKFATFRYEPKDCENGAK